VQDHILEIRKFIPENICKKVILYFQDSFEDALTVGGLDKNIRNCLKQDMLNTDTLGKKIVSNYIQSKFFEIADIYKQRNKHFAFEKISQLELLKYDSNNYDAGYSFHVDAGSKCTDRQLSISINLNNNFEGGEFVFNVENDHKQYPQNTGDIVAFPSSFLFPHQVNKIKSGSRYAIVGWIQ
jgi:predicted 2-oxoglutarate/Fe(II)-dependent dioxygenase YbiX